MAIAVILPLTDQRMIAVTLRQRRIGDEKLEGLSAALRVSCPVRRIFHADSQV
jgi:hypothetical protein